MNKMLENALNLHSFGKRLCKARKDKGLSQKKLSELLGYKRHTTIYNLEADKATPDLAALVKISEILEVNLHWLITGDDSFKRAVETLVATDKEQVRKPYAERYDKLWRNLMNHENSQQHGEPSAKINPAMLKKMANQKAWLSDLLGMLTNFAEVQFRLKAILNMMNLLSDNDEDDLNNQ